MKLKSSEEEQCDLKPITDSGFPQRQSIGAVEGVKVGQKVRDVFELKAKTRTKSQTKNGIKREIMEQFSNSNSSSRDVVFKETVPLKTSGNTEFTKKIIHDLPQKSSFQRLVMPTTSRKL